jgi:hypothetical protein
MSSPLALLTRCARCLSHSPSPYRSLRLASTAAKPRSKTAAAAAVSEAVPKKKISTKSTTTASTRKKKADTTAAAAVSPTPAASATGKKAAVRAASTKATKSAPAAAAAPGGGVKSAAPRAARSKVVGEEASPGAAKPAATPDAAKPAATPDAAKPAAPAAKPADAPAAASTRGNKVVAEEAKSLSPATNKLTDAAPLPEIEEAAVREVKERVAPEMLKSKVDTSSREYKSASRKYVSVMVALPILLVTSYVLFDRCEYLTFDSGGVLRSGLDERTTDEL